MYKAAESADDSRRIGAEGNPVDPRTLLKEMFDAAVDSAQPSTCVPRHLPQRPVGHITVIGAGKASAAMAQALEKHWGPPMSGVVVTRYGYGAPCKDIRIVEASHPVPDQAGIAAAGEIMELVSKLDQGDHVVCLLSGGGSSLLELPGDGLTLDDMRSINLSLLRSGAPIEEMNCVRRHLSKIKGGRLAAACHPAKLLTLAMSDVPGDNPADIASGPTVADASTLDEARAIVRRYRLQLPARAHELLDDPASESVKSGDPRLAGHRFRLIATPGLALSAAARKGCERGLAVHVLGDAIEGEAREVGKVLGAIALSVADQSRPFATPCVLLSGGETTVTVIGDGRGGRNVEFLLALAIATSGHERVHALAADTDGVDGAEEIAGAFMNPTTLSRAYKKGLNARESLGRNDAHEFFEVLHDSLITGPTQTNVNDFRAIYIG